MSTDAINSTAFEGTIGGGRQSGGQPEGAAYGVAIPSEVGRPGRTSAVCGPLAGVRHPQHCPITRWYLRPAAAWLAAVLAGTRVRPVHLTYCGLLAAACAVTALAWRPQATIPAAALVLAYWFFDRADGLLARRQGTATAWGAWLDANVDELVDVGLHVAVATAAAAQLGGVWPWLLLIAFLAGKYLFLYGVEREQDAVGKPTEPAVATLPTNPGRAGRPADSHTRHLRHAGRRVSCPGGRVAATGRLLRGAYHLPGNADVRIHLLILGLLSGWLTAELAVVAGYYNFRWLVRYLLVARRLRGGP